MRAINHSDNSPEEVPFRDCRGDREGVGGKRLSCLNPITVLKDLLCFNQEKKEFKKKRERERENYQVITMQGFLALGMPA